MRDFIPLSQLGFGCAPVMGKVSKPEALRAMAAAYDSGITHFDVARSYGFGRAEGVLGTFIQGRRDKVTVATKFGVVPPDLGFHSKVLIPVARQVTRLFPHLKARAKSKSGKLLANRNFDVGYARRCLELSLSELRTDYIDIYLVHEPNQASLVNSEELHRFMEESVQAGKIRRWGYALQSPTDYKWTKSLGGDIIQFEGNISTLETTAPIQQTGMQRIVTRPFMGGMQGHDALDTVIRTLKLEGFLAEMDASLSDVSLCLARALCGSQGTVLCSMFSIDHIKKNMKSLYRFEQDPRMSEIISSVISMTSSKPPVKFSV